MSAGEKQWHAHCWCMMRNNGEWWFIYAIDAQCWIAVLVMNNDRTVHLLIDYKLQLETHKLKKDKEMHWIQIGEIFLIVFIFGAVRVNKWVMLYLCKWCSLLMSSIRDE